MSLPILPFMSVVVICYNQGTTLARAIESLLKQDYPKDRYEVIVVNDGSIDNTSTVMKRFHTIRGINLPKNGGISGARNAGLAAATGDVYVGFDADCVASSGWLRQLATGYTLDKPAGVGGYLVDLHPPRSLTGHYLSAMQSGPAPLAIKDRKQSRSYTARLARYVASWLQKSSVHHEAYVEVAELYGANSSFPIALLKELGGWRRDMSGVEDRELSYRLGRMHEDYHFYAISAATLMHDPDITLKQYLLRPYRRGIVNYRFHKTNNLPQPMFPTPFVMLAAFCAILGTHPLFLPLVILVLPQLLYFWWPRGAVMQRSPLFLLFPYIQLAEETMVLAGLLRGYLVVHRNRKHEYRYAPDKAA